MLPAISAARAQGHASCTSVFVAQSKTNALSTRVLSDQDALAAMRCSTLRYPSKNESGGHMVILLNGIGIVALLAALALVFEGFSSWARGGSMMDLLAAANTIGFAVLCFFGAQVLDRLTGIQVQLRKLNGEKVAESASTAERLAEAQVS